MLFLVLSLILPKAVIFALKNECYISRLQSLNNKIKIEKFYELNAIYNIRFVIRFRIRLYKYSVHNKVFNTIDN